MDKVDFIQKAPVYYALAIAASLLEGADDFRTEHAIGRNFTIHDEDANEDLNYIENAILFDQGIELLREWGAVNVIPDDFGPPVYQRAAEFPIWWQSASHPLFTKYKQMGSTAPEWLRSALQSVNENYRKLDLRPEDFSQESLDDRWEPIPLDRTDVGLQKVTAALDQAIEKIEADNGYAATAPGERDYVLSSLKTVTKAIKEQSQICWMQIRTFALEPLGRVIKRFGTAAVGLAAMAARDTLLDWLKRHFAKALDWF